MRIASETVPHASSIVCCVNPFLRATNWLTVVKLFKFNPPTLRRKSCFGVDGDAIDDISRNINSPAEANLSGGGKLDGFSESSSLVFSANLLQIIFATRATREELLNEFLILIFLALKRKKCGAPFINLPSHEKTAEEVENEISQGRERHLVFRHDLSFVDIEMEHQFTDSHKLDTWVWFRVRRTSLWRIFVLMRYQIQSMTMKRILLLCKWCQQ